MMMMINDTARLKSKILFLVLCLMVFPVSAKQKQKSEKSSQASSACANVAAAAVRKATGGRVLSIKAGKGGQGVSRARVLLPDGRVRTLRVDACSGRVLD